MKLFEKRFVEARYGQELFNGFRIGTSVSFENRRALFNSSDYTTLNQR